MIGDAAYQRATGAAWVDGHRPMTTAQRVAAEWYEARHEHGDEGSWTPSDAIDWFRDEMDRRAEVSGGGAS